MKDCALRTPCKVCGAPQAAVLLGEEVCRDCFMWGVYVFGLTIGSHSDGNVPPCCYPR